MSAELELTVVVPVFDRAASVTRALATILSQPGNISVVVVDDGSSPECAAALDELPTEGSRVRLLRQRNQGPAAARNAGLGLTTSRYVMFLDSDDELAEAAVAAVNALLQGGVGLLCGAVRVVSPDGTVCTKRPAALPGVPWGKLSSLAGSFVVRTDVARAVGGYDKALRFGENTDFILRVAEECRKRSLGVAATDDVLSVYYTAFDERRYDGERLDAAVHLLRRGRFDLEVPGVRARLHGIAAVNASRLKRYGLAVRHSLLAALVQPRNPRHLVRLALSLSGPAARRLWLRS